MTDMDLFPFYPKELFRFGAVHSLSSYFSEKVIQICGYGEPLSQIEIRRLQWYPTVVASICDANTTRRTAYFVNHILTDHRSQFLAFAQNPHGIGQYVEPLLLRSPEFTYRLIRYYEKCGVVPLQKPEVYHRSLAMDPNYLCLVAKDQKHEIMFHSEAKRYDSAEHAFFYLDNHSTPRVDDELISVLATSEEYALRTAKLFAATDDEDLKPFTERLMQRIRSPRYLYSALMDAHLHQWHAKMEAEITRHGPWFVEYAEKSKMDISRLLNLLAKYGSNLATHECRPELTIWVRFRSDTLHLVYMPTTPSRLAG